MDPTLKCDDHLPAPTNLTATAGSACVDLAWTRVPDPVAAPWPDGVRIQRADGEGSTYFEEVGATKWDATSWSDTGVEADQTYTYRVCEHYDNDTRSTTSNEVTVVVSDDATDGGGEGEGSIIVVETADALQGAIDAAQPGDTIALIAGTVYEVGMLYLPAKTGLVTLTTQGALPDRRVQPDDSFAILRSGNPDRTIDATGATNWRLDGLEFEASTDGHSDIIRLQDSAHITLDRLLIVAGPQGQKRAICGNGTDITLSRSYIANIFATGMDSQAFCAWDGAGPYTITDNYLEAGSENIMFGGADSKSPERVPSNILIEGNTIGKPESWRGVEGKYAVKNLLEFKVGKHILVRDNQFSGSWTDAQDGYAILLKSVNQGGAAPWTALEDVEITGNTITDVESGFNILGISADQPGGQTTRLNIHHNELTAEWTAFKLGGKAGEVTVEDNQLTHGGNLVTLYGEYAAECFRFNRNRYKDVDYGIKGDGTASGEPSLQRYCTTYEYDENVAW
jgi:hypothetical protein